MNYTNSQFTFSIPDSWTAFNENNRQVFQSEGGMELIFSVNTVSKNVEAGFDDEIRTKLIALSLTAILNAASIPELKIVKPTQKVVMINGIEKWELGCEVINEDYIFEQAVLAADSAVLLVTFESSKTPEAIEFYKNFILSFDINTQK